jgi:hypothetical protein
MATYLHVARIVHAYPRLATFEARASCRTGAYVGEAMMTSRTVADDAQFLQARRLVADLTEMVEQLREALAGVAERELPGDTLPCFCVSYERGVHDEWCLDARVVLAKTADVTSEPLDHDTSDSVTPARVTLVRRYTGS